MQTLAITVNGSRVETAARTLADLVANLHPGDVRVATAHNGAFVPQRARDDTRLSDGDVIEILTARQGG